MCACFMILVGCSAPCDTYFKLFGSYDTVKSTSQISKIWQYRLCELLYQSLALLVCCHVPKTVVNSPHVHVICICFVSRAGAKFLSRPFFHQRMPRQFNFSKSWTENRWGSDGTLSGFLPVHLPDSSSVHLVSKQGVESLEALQALVPKLIAP